MMKKIELLSPAKDLEHGKTAINFGADAVYIGAQKYGARISAGNTIGDIESLCNYAHRFHAKVYVAFNTIMYDEDLKDAENLIKQIYEVGADALIVQDMSVLEMYLPPIELHVSTQAHNFDLERIVFFEKVGFSRVILAREMSLQHVSMVKSNTNIELEVFVHGALCVSFSGQCYMSAFLGGRSGNRGECAQPCRLCSRLLDKNKINLDTEKQYLSIRDMNRSEFIPDLINAGISSFKIEGRLKDLNYVKNITAFYRQKIDEAILNDANLKNSSIGKMYYYFQPDPYKTFNRGFTDYFLNGRNDKISAKTSKSIGKHIGYVDYTTKDFIQIVSDDKIVNGDGLCWFDSDNVLTGINVSKVDNNKVFIDKQVKIHDRTKIYRNFDIVFNKQLASIDNCRKIEASISICEIDVGIEISMQSVCGQFSVSKVFNINKILAKNQDKAILTLKNQLCKTGATNFEVVAVNTSFNAVLFFSIAEINGFRREIIEMFEKDILSKFMHKQKSIFPNDVAYFEKELPYKANIANFMAEKFYKRHGVHKIDKAFEKNRIANGTDLMTTKLCLRYENDSCTVFQSQNNEFNPAYIVINNQVFGLEFDCNKCVMKIISV